MPVVSPELANFLANVSQLEIITMADVMIMIIIATTTTTTIIIIIIIITTTTPTTTTTIIIIIIIIIRRNSELKFCTLILWFVKSGTRFRRRHQRAPEGEQCILNQNRCFT
jgi:hypothetical protein